MSWRRDHRGGGSPRGCLRPGRRIDRLAGRERLDGLHLGQQSCARRQGDDRHGARCPLAVVTRAPLSITSRDNPLLVRLRRLAQGQYRRVGLLWLEGDHLCRAALQRGWILQDAVLPASAWDDAPQLRQLAGAAARVVMHTQYQFYTHNTHK